MDLDLSYPAVSDLRRRARRRMPRFAFEYLDSATGSEAGARRNRQALDAVGFLPAVMQGRIEPELSCSFMGQDYDLPIVMAPIGMAGAVWPGAEKTLARAAPRLGLAYCQSTVAAATPEDTGKLTKGRGWFQHYPVADDEIRQDMLRRIKEAGFHTLVITVDVPGESRRERQRRALLAMPPKLTPRIIAELALAPGWPLAMAQHGAPRMAFPEAYVSGRGASAFQHAGRLIRGYPDREDVKRLRDLWQGPILIKGIQRPEDALWALSIGIEGIWVSNHTGRQFEAGPAAIEVLPHVREAVGPDVPVIYDSGIEGGLDILRALALGADFVSLGRAFLYAVAAFGSRGLDHLAHILRADMIANMTQLGVRDYAGLPGALVPGGVRPA